MTKGKMGHLIGETPKYEVDDPNKKCQSKTSLIISLLINSMEPTIGGYLTYFIPLL